jgi:hypothetical protein
MSKGKGHRTRSEVDQARRAFLGKSAGALSFYFSLPSIAGLLASREVLGAGITCNELVSGEIAFFNIYLNGGAGVHAFHDPLASKGAPMLPAQKAILGHPASSTYAKGSVQGSEVIFPANSQGFRLGHRDANNNFVDEAFTTEVLNSASTPNVSQAMLAAVHRTLTCAQTTGSTQDDGQGKCFGLHRNLTAAGMIAGKYAPHIARGNPGGVTTTFVPGGSPTSNVPADSLRAVQQIVGFTAAGLTKEAIYNISRAASGMSDAQLSMGLDKMTAGKGLFEGLFCANQQNQSLFQTGGDALLVDPAAAANMTEASYFRAGAALTGNESTLYAAVKSVVASLTGALTINIDDADYHNSDGNRRNVHAAAGRLVKLIALMCNLYNRKGVITITSNGSMTFDVVTGEPRDDSGERTTALTFLVSKPGEARPSARQVGGYNKNSVSDGTLGELDVHASLLVTALSFGGLPASKIASLLNRIDIDSLNGMG